MVNLVRGINRCFDSMATRLGKKFPKLRLFVFLPRKKGVQFVLVIVLLFGLAYALFLTFFVFTLPSTTTDGRTAIETTKSTEHRTTLMVYDRPLKAFPSNATVLDSFRPTPGKLTAHSTVDRWQPLDNSLIQQAFVFSAFLDTRGRVPVVRVMAISTSVGKQFPLYCHVWYGQSAQRWSAEADDATTPHIYKAEAEFIPEGHGFRYTASIFRCKLSNSTKERLPVSVSISKHNKPSHVFNYMTLHLAIRHAVRTNSSKSPTTPPVNFTVCISPLNRYYGNYTDQFVEFLEFVEIHRIFGASRFVLYNESIGNQLDPLVRQYMKEGVVQVVDWKLPVNSAQDGLNEIHYYGQLVALNDCLYRSMSTSRYIAFLDLDELVVPQKVDSWLQMIHDINQKAAEANIVSYVFPNVFFRKEWSPDNETSSLPSYNGHKIRSLTYTKREVRVHVHGVRSKCIVRAAKLNVMGIHFVFAYRSGREHYVSARDGLLYHYRNWSDYTESGAYRTDRRMYDFKEDIIKRIDKHARSLYS